MKDNWKSLVVRYADGQEICNCGDAYLTNCGTIYRGGKVLKNQPECKYGCSANQSIAKDYVAKRVMQELAPYDIIKSVIQSK